MSRKKLKILLILVLCLFVFVLTGCNKDEDEKDRDDVKEESVEESPVDWANIYLDAFKEDKIEKSDKMKICFVDRNDDKIPEMYYSYVAESSENYKSSPNNADGMSTYTRSASIFIGQDRKPSVTTSYSSEITSENDNGYTISFLHLLPTDEYVWGISSLGSDFSITSLKTGESYQARVDRGTPYQSNDIIYEYTDIADAVPISVDSTNIDDEFEERFNRAVDNYVPNSKLIDLIENGTDISNWEDFFYKAITKDEIVVPSQNAQITFVDVDDNDIPDMIYSYLDEKNYITTKVYKLTKAGYVTPVRNANSPTRYGSGYQFDMKVRFGYINKKDRDGWVLTSPAGEVLYTDDFYVQERMPFYLNSSHPDTGMAQYDAYTICELVKEDEIPEGLGEFITIDTTTFDEDFDESFEDATSKYQPNSVIRGEADEEQEEEESEKDSQKDSDSKEDENDN